MDKYITIKAASVVVGVTTTTLRRWERDGLFTSHHRTLGNHRRYLLSDVLKLVYDEDEVLAPRKTICYARVSSHDQKEDLSRQALVLHKYCVDNNLTNIESINDIGSGLNFKKLGLNKLLKLILTNQVDKIILTHKDRLLRFGSDLVINIAKHYNVETIILNNQSKTFEEELSSDVLEIITVFSAKLYGSRSHKNKKICNLT
jgi:predicted site-specific integrase-resolvase